MASISASKIQAGRYTGVKRLGMRGLKRFNPAMERARAATERIKSGWRFGLLDCD